MNDLLSKSFGAGKAMNYVDLKRDVMRDLEKGATEMGSLDKNLVSFFDEISYVKTEMEKIRQLLAKLQDANDESKTIHRAAAMKALRDRMDRDVEEVLRLARSIKGKLEELDRANMENRKRPGYEEGTTADRARMTVTVNERKKLKDLMGEFQKLREKMMGEYRETIERRYFTITGQQADERTIEEIIETGESENFLQKAIQEQGRGNVIETVMEIQERHGAVKEIEKSLLELHQIFLDMAVLVESQGEQLDDIEQQVSKACNYVEKGSKQLHSAKQHQRGTRKCMCIGIILMLVMIIMVVIPVVTSIKKA